MSENSGLTLELIQDSPALASVTLPNGEKLSLQGVGPKGLWLWRQRGSKEELKTQENLDNEEFYFLKKMVANQSSELDSARSLIGRLGDELKEAADTLQFENYQNLEYVESLRTLAAEAERFLCTMTEEEQQKAMDEL